MRSRFRRLQGARKPAPSPGDACLVQFRGSRHLVDGRSIFRRRSAGVLALLRGRTHDCDERCASRHSMSGRSRTMPPVQEPSSNIAARMARWSAHHRKIAIFGWLGCVIAIFAIGNFALGQKQIVFETSGPGESGRANTIIYEDFKQPGGESVLVQSETLTASDPAFRATVQAVIAGRLESRRSCEGRVTVRHGEQRPDLRRQEIRPRPDGDQGAFGRRRGQDRPGRRPRRRAAESAPRVHHRLVRRKHREGSRGCVLRRPEEGRVSTPSR